MNKTEIKHKKKLPIKDIILAILTIALFAILIRFVNWHDVSLALKSAKWYILPLILITSAGSYIALGYGFYIATRLFGINIERKALFQLAVFSSVINNVTPGAGVPSYSFRVYMARQAGQSGSHMLAASVFHSFWYTVILYVCMVVGIINLSLSPASPHKQFFLLLMPIAVIPLIIASILVLASKVRHGLFAFIKNLTFKLTRKDISETLDKFDEALDLGTLSIKENPRAFRKMLIFIAIDWLMVMVTEWLCFFAFSTVVSPLTLITGVSISQFIGIASMLPGGLGAQETTIAGIYTFFGIPFSKTVISAILFRLMYTLIPAAVTILALWPLLKTLRKSSKEAVKLD